MVKCLGLGWVLVAAVLACAPAHAEEQGCVWAKLQADDTPADLGDLVVTAKFTGCIYAQHKDGQAGIRINIDDTSINENDLIFVHGAVGTEGHERVINAGNIETIAVQWRVPQPRAMTNRDVGGGMLGILPNGQKGPVGGMGINNIGLLVRTWGYVSESFPDMKYVIIDDGCGTPVKVDCSNCATLPERGDYIGATGISSLHAMGLRLVIARRDQDVTVYCHSSG